MDRQTDVQTDFKAGRLTDSQTDLKADRLTDKAERLSHKTM
jgi:hypothetical protein